VEHACLPQNAEPEKMHTYDQGDPGDGELMGANYYVDHDQATHQGGRLRGHD
jgi:hypothetical protein